MKLGLGIKISTCGDIKHQVRLLNVPLTILKERGNKYYFTVKKENTCQKILIRVLFNKSIILKKNDIKGDGFSVSFSKDRLNIHIESLSAVRRIKRQKDMYCISYSPKDGDRLLFEVKNYITKDYYKNKVLPRINGAKEKAKNNRSQKARKSKRYTPEELRRRDFCNADRFTYNYSQNSDGNRNKREVFGGSFSNLSKSKKNLR